MPHLGDPGVVAMPGVCPTPGLQGASRSRGLPDPGRGKTPVVDARGRPTSPRAGVVGHLTSTSNEMQKSTWGRLEKIDLGPARL